MKRLLLAALFILFGLTQAFCYENERTVESVATTDSTKGYFTNISTGATVDTVSESLVNFSMAGSVGVMWQVTSPSGKIYTITGELRNFCAEHNLSCAKVFKIIHGYKPTRGNCVGWSFERQLQYIS